MVFRRISGFILLGISLPCAGVPRQAAQPPSQSGLADASLEELMNIEVTSVSKKSQPLSSTAASVFVISAEDIRRSGITVLPELLRLAPGVQVARLATGEWSIGIRGFSNEYSNKLLVLVDGRSVYNEFVSGVVWDALNLSVDDLERIEAIRGPGAAMWGTNAVNGVINIITKSAKDTQGGLVTGAGGSEATSAETVRYGGETSRGADYRIGAQNTQSDPFRIVGSANPSLGWNSRSANFRLDWDVSANDSLLVSGLIFDSSRGMLVSTGTISAPNTPPAADKVVDSGGNVAVRWQHVVSETSSIEVRFSFEHLRLNDPQIMSEMNFLDYGFQQHIHAGSRNDVIWGLTVRRDSFESTPTPMLRMNPLNNNRDEVAIFAEDEIALIPNKLSFVVGAQAAYTSTIGYTIQPTGRLLWTPSPILSSWIAVSRADRTPSLFERALDFYQAPIAIPSGSPSVPPLLAVQNILGTPTVRSETVLAYEAGQRIQATKQISFDISTFYNVYQHLMSYSAGAPVLAFSSGMPYLQIPIAAGNQMYGASYGTDLAATWNVASRWRLTGGYSWLRVETHPYAGDNAFDDLFSSAEPHYQWNLRSNFDLTRTIQIDTALYYTAAMLESGIPQHLRGDLRIGWRLSRKIEFSGGVQDAFQANHLEAVSLRFNQYSQVPRNFYAKVTWRF